MKYKFYHEVIYQVARKLANFHINHSLKCISVMRKMTDRFKENVNRN